MNPEYRKYAPGDIPAMKALWADVFGDSREFIDGFFRLLPGAGWGVAAVCGGELAAMAYVLSGISVNGNKCAYIYAVATREEFRGLGLGAGAVRKCAELAREEGCAVVCTSPADLPLYGWYGRVLGTAAAAYTSELRLEAGKSAEPAAAAADVSYAEYNRLRETLLSGTPHAVFSDGFAAIEEMLCRAYGGGLCKIGGGIAACYVEDGVLCVRELLCRDGELRSCAAGLMARFGCASAAVRVAGRAQPLIAAAPAAALPEGFVWGLALD